MKSKILKVLGAAFLITVANFIVGMLTCGTAFNWVYTLEPTSVWKDMSEVSFPLYNLAQFLINIIFVSFYMAFSDGIPGKSKLIKGLTFGMCVWCLGMLNGMLATAMFMTVNMIVILYWLVQGFIVYLINGVIAAYICTKEESKA